MDRTAHFAVAPSIPKGDPHSGDWAIRARPHQGGDDWVLTQGNRPPFSECQKA